MEIASWSEESVLECPGMRESLRGKDVLGGVIR